MKEFALAALVALLILALGVIGLLALGARMLLETARAWLPTAVEDRDTDWAPLDELVDAPQDDDHE